MSITLAPAAIGSVGAAADLAGRFAQRAKRVLTGREKSLIDFARAGQITPMVIIDSDIRYNPLTKDILHVLSTLFTAYYMQALAYENLIGDVTIAKRLEKFNPGSAGSTTRTLSFESHGGYGLPGMQGTGFEAAYDNGKSDSKDGKKVEILTKDNMNELHEDRSLAIGKILSIKMADAQGGTQTVPVTVRLQPMVMDSGPLINAYAMGSRWNSQSERKHRVNMGMLRYIEDYWFKMDMIKQHRDALLADKSGTYAVLSDRRTKKLLDGLISGKDSAASAAAMSVISAKTAKELERQLGGKLSNYNSRAKLFNELSLMILVVFDPTYEQMTFYYRDTVEETRLTAAEIKSNSKKQDVNVMEIISTFMNKGAPTF